MAGEGVAGVRAGIGHKTVVGQYIRAPRVHDGCSDEVFARLQFLDTDATPE